MLNEHRSYICILLEFEGCTATACQKRLIDWRLCNADLSCCSFVSFLARWLSRRLLSGNLPRHVWGRQTPLLPRRLPRRLGWCRGLLPGGGLAGSELLPGDLSGDLWGRQVAVLSRVAPRLVHVAILRPPAPAPRFVLLVGDARVALVALEVTARCLQRRAVRYCAVGHVAAGAAAATRLLFGAVFSGLHDGPHSAPGAAVAVFFLLCFVVYADEFAIERLGLGGFVWTPRLQ